MHDQHVATPPNYLTTSTKHHDKSINAHDNSTNHHATINLHQFHHLININVNTWKHKPKWVTSYCWHHFQHNHPNVNSTSNIMTMLTSIPILQCQQNYPTLRGCPLLHITHDALIPWSPKHLWRKINQRKRHMNKGGKKKGQVTHVPWFAPSYTHIPRCGIPLSLLPLYHDIWFGWFPQSLFHSITISFPTYHLRDVLWTCHPL